MYRNWIPPRTVFLLCAFTCLIDASHLSAQTARQESSVLQRAPKLSEFQIPSSVDGKPQPVLVWGPRQAKPTPVPVLIYLHSWSGDYRQDNSAWLKLAADRNWIFLHPNFRGRNDHPEACGSRVAQQDILDALDWVQGKFAVDKSRVYLAGASGGGHMAMLMAGRYPKRFSAVCAWVGISDLAAWYEFHRTYQEGEPSRYAKMILQCTGGAPGESEQIDAEFRARSPIHFLHQINDLPLDLSAGIHDGHSGSVPIRHTLNAYNVIAQSHGTVGIAAKEIENLASQKPLTNPSPSDEFVDREFGRRIYLRRQSRQCRVSIFEGGHESIPRASIEFLARHRRPTE